MVDLVVADIPLGALCLAFLDPYGLHLDFDTLAKLAKRRADLIIFFPDRLDVLRNVETYYFDNSQSNLDRVLGFGVNWREIWRETPRSLRAQRLRELYEAQLKQLGYRHFDHEPIPSSRRPLYKLIFCSKAKVAADIWRRTSLKKRGGQASFDFL